MNTFHTPTSGRAALTQRELDAAYEQGGIPVPLVYESNSKAVWNTWDAAWAQHDEGAAE